MQIWTGRRLEVTRYVLYNETPRGLCSVTQPSVRIWSRARLQVVRRVFIGFLFGFQCNDDAHNMRVKKIHNYEGCHVRKCLGCKGTSSDFLDQAHLDWKDGSSSIDCKLYYLNIDHCTWVWICQNEEIGLHFLKPKKFQMKIFGFFPFAISFSIYIWVRVDKSFVQQ